MNAAEAIEQHRSFLAEIGEDVIVRRYAADRSNTDIPVKARVVGYQPGELVGAIVQGDRRVIMLAEPLTGLLPLTNADKLVIRGDEVAIKGVDDSTRRIGGTLVALEIHVEG
jgi:hypothetical protein